MFKIKLKLCLFLMFNYFHDATPTNYSPYANHFLRATSSDNDGYDTQQPASNQNPVYHQNLQGNSNYQQMYRYYYPPSYQQQQRLLPKQPTQLWFGPPIVVDDDLQQQQQSSTNIPSTLYQQHSTSSSIRSSELLPFLHRNSKVLPPTVYNPQTTTRTTQFNYDNDNNNYNNIVYHKDFRHQSGAIPESQHAQEDIASLNNQQQQHQLLEQQHQQQGQPQQFYVTNTNLRYNGISNDLTSLRKDNVPDYGEHFKRYLENNPHRIKPIY